MVKNIVFSLVIALSINPLYAVQPVLTDLQKTIPYLTVELPYATPNNFTGKKVYPSHAKAYLLPEPAAALAKVQAVLNQEGLGLLIWDAYRPLPVQEIFWSICPDENYVMPPHKGSRHNKGAAVDVTLIRLNDNKELPMPTKFDDFTPKAWRTAHEGLAEEQIANRNKLETVMTKYGFKGLRTEWWHFDWAKALEHPEQYPVLIVDFNELIEQNT